MIRAALFVLILLLLGGVLVFQNSRPTSSHSDHQPRDSARVEPSPVTPWRNPAADLATLFPGATNFVVESRILSGLLVPIQKQLGRLLHPEENPFRIYRVMGGERPIGLVLLSRAKGEHGGIEIVTAVETNGTVRRVRIQSHREPRTVAGSIDGEAWLESFAGKTSRSPLQLGDDLPQVPDVARRSAEAIAVGVRDQLILLGYAQTAPEARELQPHAHH